MSDFAEVRRLVAAAAKATFGELRAQNPDEQFYALALYDCDDATGPQVSANSEQKFQMLLARHRASHEKKGEPLSERDVANYRWGTAEWWYEAEGGEHFAPAYGLLESLSIAAGGYAEFRAHAFAALVGALCDLDREGVFGTGAAREAVTVFVSLSDSADAWWLKRESARLANPPGVFARFEREALAPPPEPTAESSGSDRYEWAQYQRRLATPPGETHGLFLRLVASWDCRP